MDAGGLGVGGVAYGGETPLYTVLPWRLVLVSRTPHRQLLLENLTDKSSSTGAFFFARSRSSDKALSVI